MDVETREKKQVGGEEEEFGFRHACTASGETLNRWLCSALWSASLPGSWLPNAPAP